MLFYCFLVIVIIVRNKKKLFSGRFPCFSSCWSLEFASDFQALTMASKHSWRIRINLWKFLRMPEHFDVVFFWQFFLWKTAFQHTGNNRPEIKNKLIPFWSCLIKHNYAIRLNSPSTSLLEWSILATMRFTLDWKVNCGKQSRINGRILIKGSSKRQALVNDRLW